MSTEQENADHFSRSPSLLDILSYVTYNDIESVKKINQHLSDVTNKYQMHLPRPRKTAYFVFSMQRHNGKNERHVEVYLANGVRICISNERYRQCIPKHRKYDKLRESADQPCAMMGEGVESSALKAPEYIDIPNVMGGLQYLSSVYSRQFHFDSITFIKSEKLSRRQFLNFINAMAYYFKKNFCRCRELIVEKAYDGVERVCAAIGSNKVITHLPVNLAQWIPLQKFDRLFKVTAYFVSLETIIDLLKRWLAIEVQIHELKIFFPRGHDFGFSTLDILTALQGFELTDEKRIPHVNHYEAVIRRPSDSLFLCFTCFERKVFIKEQRSSKIDRNWYEK